MEVQKWLDIALDFIINFGPKVLGAIIIWIIGSWVIKKLLKAAGKVMTKGNYDDSIGQLEKVKHSFWFNKGFIKDKIILNKYVK